MSDCANCAVTKKLKAEIEALKAVRKEIAMNDKNRLVKDTVEPLVRQSSSCWLTDDSELHPATDCPSSGDWLTVATNGHERWINCSQCNGTWYLPNATDDRTAVADTLEDIVRCENCGGSGVISYNPNLNPNAFPATASAKCTRCGGTGIEDTANSEGESRAASARTLHPLVRNSESPKGE